MWVMSEKAWLALGLEGSGRCWGQSSGDKDTEKASGEKRIWGTFRGWNRAGNEGCPPAAGDCGLRGAEDLGRWVEGTESQLPDQESSPTACCHFPWVAASLVSWGSSNPRALLPHFSARMEVTNNCWEGQRMKPNHYPKKQIKALLLQMSLPAKSVSKIWRDLMPRKAVNKFTKKYKISLWNNMART